MSGQSVAMFPHPNEVHDRMSEYGTPHRAGHRSMNKPPSAHSYRPEYSSSANQHRFHLWVKEREQTNFSPIIITLCPGGQKHSTVWHTTTIYRLFYILKRSSPLAVFDFLLSIWMYYVYINNSTLFYSSPIVFKCFFYCFTQWILSSTFYLLFLTLFFSRQT